MYSDEYMESFERLNEKNIPPQRYILFSIKWRKYD